MENEFETSASDREDAVNSPETVDATTTVSTESEASEAVSHESGDVSSDDMVMASAERWDAGIPESASAEESSIEPAAEEAVDEAELNSASEPFVGRWNRLISSTNWEKGRIIHEWRLNLIEQNAPVTEYSDEAWAKRVGGVTAPHVGRLRRVYESFGEQHETYPGLFWSHFLAALDWDDAPMWLEGAMRSGWSISQMRAARWEAQGAPAESKPAASDIIEVDTDEDVVEPAQGGGGGGNFDGDSGDITAGPLPEEPDFGDAPTADAGVGSGGSEGDDLDNLEGPGAQSLVQPFAGLPDLPDDLSEALEMFKLAIIRHKAAGWTEVEPEVVQRALAGLKLLIEARSQ